MKNTKASTPALTVGVIAATCIVFAAVQLATAQGQSPFGSLRKQLVRIADTESRRFVTALEQTVNDQFQNNAQAKQQFAAALLRNLDLDRYAADQEKVAEFERLRAILKEHFLNGEEEFEKLRLILQTRSDPAP